ncbi:DASH complex subunit Hsk3 like-domain-containing protein [Microdochium trichocladiopsis]|uniref:DASH complex subunit Hsk3 like-domain-containing protein n=1 Tax=Microdochium trichocladiopsis TaxID=1682393 RepID=A0A9P8YEQ8_9PEZI|nr:DASH complex subunit Hsk3 like-domain-containing protein [Microdochium trichocladiopsis]KAH7037532.1 DASH complex subunit Hsk3 like-domain-containing protein [Microdochium trichocladiopsis]
MATRSGSGMQPTTTTRASMMPVHGSAGGGASGSGVKSRQLTHLHSQLAQLSANLADTENLLRMTSVQAEAMKGLAAWHGGMFMAASKVLGEESVKDQQSK